jgi:hypothetical protein
VEVQVSVCTWMHVCRNCDQSEEPVGHPNREAKLSKCVWGLVGQMGLKINFIATGI